MTADDPTSGAFSLRRWSRRKLEAAQAAAEPAPAPAPIPAQPPTLPLATEPLAAPDAAAHALPPLESLTIDSDFTAFFGPKVDEGLKRKALKQLFRDPRFNVMDGLDTYIDDYSLPDPISPEIVREMVQGRYIFDPPATRVNEQGTIEDVPPDRAVVASEATEPPTLPAAPPAASDAAGAPTVVAAGDAEALATEPDARDAGPPAIPEKPEPATR